jgi:inorganic pyrophosphatase
MSFVVMTAIPTREPGTARVNVVIDTPAGSRNKYKYDADLQLFRLSRVLPEGLVFPHDFGSIPGTCAADGDALDCLVLQTDRTFPGCLVTARLIGIVYAEQRESGKVLRNDRLIAVADTAASPAALKDLAGLGPLRLRAIEHFFGSYNAFQGRPFKIRGRGGPQRAEQVLQRAIVAFHRRSTE